ncbi:MAG: hypothetical protein D6826_06875 [Alphaproteobacteria bacterium]|nr:MAG: hypothetical protein D6826_06875 [Alphaproteobacteria bacterium]
MAAQPRNFLDVVALVRERRETILANHLVNDVHLVRFETGRIELRPEAHAPRDLSGRLGRILQEATGRRWMVTISSAPGDPTLAEQAETARARRREAVLAHPLVRAALDAFPGARLIEPSSAPLEDLLSSADRRGPGGVEVSGALMPEDRDNDGEDRR